MGYEFTPDTFKSWLGLKVVKKSGKPFKSTFKVNTIKGAFPFSQFTGKPYFTFHEDDSMVDCHLCKIVLF